LLKSLFSFLLILFSAQAHTSDKVSFQGNIYKQIYAYEKEQKKFSKEVCQPGVDFKYYKLLKNYRGDGVYLPILQNRIDRDAIRKNLKYIKEKKKYIASILKKLKKNKRLAPIRDNTTKIQEQIDVLLEFKKADVKSKKKMKDLEASFDKLVEDVYYLKSYKYPNDHLINRMKYDELLGSSKRSQLKKKNEIYFYRKLIEDGAYDKDHKRSDIYTRSTLDTIKRAFLEKPDKLSESLRYDLEWAISKIESNRERSTAKQVERMNEWYGRTSSALDYYRGILKLSLKDEYKLIKKRNESTQELKDYVYEKQAEVFEYWTKKSEILKTLFTLETILFNEVGGIDGEDALERTDVVKIVLNRLYNPKYNQVTKGQEIVKHLKTDAWKKDHTLGTLFKRGEFSFTYYYIPSVVKIFCPDMTRLGKRLRAQNLKISLKQLKDYKYDFKASRYFSRVSMFGKIDMSKVWSNYEAYPQRRGVIYSNQSRIYRKFKKKKYRYLYEFTDPSGEVYTVIEIEGTNYAVKKFKTKPVFYKYRSPHLFTYFTKK